MPVERLRARDCPPIAIILTDQPRNDVYYVRYSGMCSVNASPDRLLKRLRHEALTLWQIEYLAILNVVIVRPSGALLYARWR